MWLELRVRLALGGIAPVLGIFLLRNVGAAAALELCREFGDAPGLRGAFGVGWPESRAPIPAVPDSAEGVPRGRRSSRPSRRSPGSVRRHPVPDGELTAARKELEKPCIYDQDQMAWRGNGAYVQEQKSTDCATWH
jgi:hypothetical protein